jgi:hypothetical protein
VAPASSAAPTAPALVTGSCFGGLGLWGSSSNRGLLKDRFLHPAINICRSFRHVLLSKFRDERLESSHRLGRSFDRSGGRRGGLHTQASEGFLGFLFPLRPTEAFCGGRVPPRSFGMLSGFLVDSRQLKRNHRVARALEQSCQLSWGVGAGSGLADACLYLPPIAHSRIVAVVCKPGQPHCPKFLKVLLGVARFLPQRSRSSLG